MLCHLSNIRGNNTWDLKYQCFKFTVLALLLRVIFGQFETLLDLEQCWRMPNILRGSQRVKKGLALSKVKDIIHSVINGFFLATSADEACTCRMSGKPV